MYERDKKRQGWRAENPFPKICTVQEKSEKYRKSFERVQGSSVWDVNACGCNERAKRDVK